MWIWCVCLVVYLLIGIYLGYCAAVSCMKESIEEDGGISCVEAIVTATIVVTLIEMLIWPLDIFYTQVIRRIIKAVHK